MPKKSKATKVTDADKPWNRKSKTSVYKIESISINKTIAIVCEGQTEKVYFESFPVLGLKVKAINLEGQSKLKLVELTHDLILTSNDEFDEIWCVYDMDVKQGTTEYSDFDNSISKAQSLGYKVAYSNDSFELWFYLHYNYTDTQNSRTYYYEELSKRFEINYEKEGKKFSFCLQLYKFLMDDPYSSQREAIVRAEKLFTARKHLPFHQQNPVTTVYQLVQELNKNVRQ